MTEAPEPHGPEEPLKPEAGATVSEADALKQALDEAKAKAADTFDQLIRLRAEFDNFRRRAEKEKSEARRWGKEEVILQLVSLMDVMEQAEAAAHTSPDVKSMVQGLDMLYGEFKRLLRAEGLEEVAVKEGDAYRHDAHEAVESVESEEEDGRILAVLKKGYRFQGQLVRPVWVKISKRKKEEKSPSALPAAEGSE